MATNKPDESPRQAGPAISAAFIKRELSGSTFLTLEHVLHMLLVVVVPGVIAMGIVSAISMWIDAQPDANATMMMGSWLMSGMQYLTAVWSIGLVAAMVVLVPFMLLMEWRTRSEWQKRAGFTSRVAYRAPVYVALGLITAIIALAKICLITVIIKSLVFIGVDGVDIGAMYRDEFVPALVVLLLFTGAGWYVFRLAKGHDYSKTFSAVAALLAAVVSVALLITAATVVRDSSAAEPLLPPGIDSTPYMDMYEEGQPMPDFDRMFDY